MKILYVTTIGVTMSFFKLFIARLIAEGHVVDIATNEQNGKTPVDDDYRKLGCRIYSISCERSPLSTGTYKAIKELRTILKTNSYDIVHCHTPVAAMCTRFAAKGLRKKGLKVVYTAHGFHFYRGAPKKNWLLYYPIEKLCSRWTDVLITINREDYTLAKKKMKAVRIEYVPGVGIDTGKFMNASVDRRSKRKTIDVPEDAFMILSVGELNENKNHQVVICALKELCENVHYVIAGTGQLQRRLSDLANALGVSKRVHLLGQRNDVAELYKAADVYALPSKREGLNVSLMEAMASGLPVVCSCIRGNVDLIQGGRNGLLFDFNDAHAFALAVKKLKGDDLGRVQMIHSNQSDIRFADADNICRKMEKIYLEQK